VKPPSHHSENSSGRDLSPSRIAKRNIYKARHRLELWINGDVPKKNPGGSLATRLQTVISQDVSAERKGLYLAALPASRRKKMRHPCKQFACALQVRFFLSEIKDGHSLPNQ
jgi:hypothetical protein